MELIEIQDVEVLDGAFDYLAGASVEVPESGAECARWRMPISGWIVGRYEPVIAVDIVHEHARIAGAGVEIARDDVAAAHTGLPGADRAGFSVRIGGVWLPENFTLKLEAAFANGHRVSFAAIRGRRAALPAAPALAIEPISVTALPRSGATLVMQMLAAHPNVVVAGAHPYSMRPAAYWEHLVRVLSAPANSRSSAHPDTFDAEVNWVGSHPFNGPPLTDSPEVDEWLGRDYVEALAAFAASATNGLYARLAASQHLASPQFYAEKREPGPTARLTSILHPGAREIIVVRDFRDMACSMLAFARKTGSNTREEEEFVLSLVPALARLVAYVHERAGDALVVRYEDLIGAPARAFEEIAGHLALDSAARVLRAIEDEIAAETPELAAHRTSADAASSVARHTGELQDDVLATADEAFRPALDAFGYATAREVTAV